ncbi:putative ribonuclease H protein [Acorus calamus]|uniref:Ribonuclease H protein n=1 Tax=Acorus calamus TaxID=4465 RepID=A0AAV9E9K9_ACOCL|nr:putative ribonuclease H protein [Acorus calamus]
MARRCIAKQKDRPFHKEIHLATSASYGCGLKELLCRFAAISGLELNESKSQVFCGGRPDQHLQFIDALGIPVGKLPVTYLGLPLFSGALTPRLCLPLVDKVRKRLQHWHGHMLSLAGRLELAKTVLHSFQIYWSSAFALPRTTIKAMEKIIRSFLWGGPTLKKTVHHVRWEQVCSPKEEGGLGLKRIAAWMKAALGSRFWEIALCSKSLWVLWMTKRYLTKKNIWEVCPTAAGSWIWPRILASRDWIKPEVRYVIFSGREIQAWHDPWIQGASLTDVLPNSIPHLEQQQGVITHNSLVADFIQEGSWVKPSWWPLDDNEIWSVISSMECGGYGVDTLIWPHSPQGGLSTPSAWNFLRQKREEPKWKKWIWQKFQPPTSSICAWMALLDKAPTLSNLQRKGLVREVTCPMCKTEVETADHLYLNCSFAAFIWTLIFRKMGAQRPRMAGLLPFVEWLEHSFPVGAPRHIMQVVFVSAIRCLWKERCTRLFKGVESHKLQIFASLSSMVALCFRGRKLMEDKLDMVQHIANNWDVLVSQRDLKQIEVFWKPPPEGWFKSNSDGSLSADRAGYGAIVRNWKGESLRAIAVQDHGLHSINVLEYKAILAGLRLCQQMGLSQVQLESDSSTAVIWLQGRGCFPWQLMRDRHEIQFLLSGLSAWQVSHSYREGHQAADLLASLQTIPGETFLQPAQFGEDLKSILAKDAAGKTFTRLVAK